MGFGRVRRAALVLVLAATALASACSSGSTRTAATTAPSRQTGTDAEVPSTDGVRLHVRSAGSPSAARTLVLVHGGPGLSYEAMAVFFSLAGPQLRVVGYDQRGSGRSSAPADHDYAFSAYVADLEAVRAWTRADRIEVLGHSWGGAVAAGYTATYPARVSRLALLDAAPLNTAAFQQGSQQWTEREIRLVEAGVLPQLPDLPPITGDSCLAHDAALIPVYLADPHRKVDAATVLGGTCTDSVAAPSFDGLLHAPLGRLAAALSAWNGRALIVEGALDPFGPGWAATEASQLHAHATVIPAAGHWPWVEQPARVFSLLRAFV